MQGRAFLRRAPYRAPPFLKHHVSKWHVSLPRNAAGLMAREIQPHVAAAVIGIHPCHRVHLPRRLLHIFQLRDRPLLCSRPAWVPLADVLASC